MIQPWFPPVALPTINPPESVLNAASDVLSDLPISSLLSMAELGMCRAALLLSPLIVAMSSTREAAAGLSSGPSPPGRGIDTADWAKICARRVIQRRSVRIWIDDDPEIDDPSNWNPRRYGHDVRPTARGLAQRDTQRDTPAAVVSALARRRWLSTAA